MQPPAPGFCQRRYRRGFSFTEILFAVMILGIGFIMVAAIFPVALQQTETSQAETVGAAVARAGVSFVSQNSTSTFSIAGTTAGSPNLFSILQPTISPAAISDTLKLYNSCRTGIPYTLPLPPSSSYPELIGDVWSFDFTDFENINAFNLYPLSGAPPALRQIVWPLMAQNMIQASDPRYAWVAFYRRNLVQTTVVPPLYAFAPSAQLIVIALQSRAKQFYDESDVTLSTGKAMSIQPSRGLATITAPSVNSLSYTIQFNDAVLQQRAAEGAFVIIASDGLALGTSDAGTLNGHIYRLGAQVTPATTPPTWEFAPGFGPTIPPLAPPFPTETVFLGASRSFQVYMVGKGPDPNDATQYSGLAQDVAAYSTFISCPSN